MRRITLVVFIAFAALAGGLVGGAVGVALDGDSSAGGTPTARAAEPQPAAVSVTRDAGLTPEDIYRQDAPGVVVITANETQVVSPGPFSPPMQQRVTALGSGFVIDRQGDIVTNDHVVQGGSGIRVGFSSGASYPATVVGTDPSTDVAVVRVHAPASALHPLTFASSAAVQVGDPVYAIGNPFGLDRTMTAGIVSATGRDIQAPDGLTIANAIQTDAPINHGNSGGPLIDRLGRVVGINSQIQGGTVDANVGVGFAIPSDTARSVADQLIRTGHASHAWLGVEVEAVDPSVAKIVRGVPHSGLMVARVLPHSPAAAAGLRAANRHVTVDGVSVLVGGDAIVAANGKPVATPQALGAIVATEKPGDHLRLTVVRGGVQRAVTVTLGNVPSGTS